MEKLIEAYLIHIDHYLKGEKVLHYRQVVKSDGDIVFECRMSNDCLNAGGQWVDINISEMLVFLFERGVNGSVNVPLWSTYTVSSNARRNGSLTGFVNLIFVSILLGDITSLNCVYSSYRRKPTR